MVIIDEFTPLPVSAQRKFQLRHLRDGKCAQCSRSLSNSHYCEYHAQKARERSVRCAKKNPLMIAAHKAVVKALYHHDIERQPCEVKGCSKLAQAHHKDYSKPLEITWLCHRHHQESHGKQTMRDPKIKVMDVGQYHRDKVKEIRKRKKSAV